MVASFEVCAHFHDGLFDAPPAHSITSDLRVKPRFIWRIVGHIEKTPVRWRQVAIRLRLAGVNPNSDAMRIMISACRLAMAG